MIGAHDDFFDLGGHSLLATRYVTRLRDSVGVDLLVRAVFEAPTVAGQARKVVAGRLSQAGAITPREDGGDAPLTFAQERMWFLDRLEPGAAYHIPLAVRLAGRLDPTALEAALQAIVRRHEALRTTFPSVDGQPVQRIAADPALFLPRIDLAALPPTLRETELSRLGAELAARLFDLEHGPLLRALLVAAGPEEHVLLACVHHIVFDGWSIGILLRELAALYRAEDLPALPIQYADWAVWQRRWMESGALDEGLAWWRGHLGSEPPVLELPGDRPRPAIPSFRGAEILTLLPPDLVAPVRALARRTGASLFITLLAAWQVILAGHSGQDDFVVGTPIAGRDRAEVEGLIGLFVNTLALRARMEAEEGFAALLARVREATLGAFAHSGVPFERVVEAVQPRRSLGHSPLFQTMLSLQSAPMPDFSLPGLALSQVDVPVRTAPFDLTLALAEGDGGLSAAWIWALDLFDAPTVARFAERFRVLLAAAAEEPERPVADLPLLTAEERHAVLQDWSGPEIALPAEPAIHRIFAERLGRWPDAVAAEYAGASLTYAALDRRARRLARRLRNLGVGPDVRVGLCAERSPDLLVGMLAALQAGGAYLPLDPGYPRERLAFLLEDAAPAVVLAQSHLADRLPEAGAPVLLLDASWEEEDDFEPIAVSGDNLACVFYTSGSTGRPKGVGVTHRGVCRIALDPYWQIGPDDRMAQVSSPSFDAATLEIWGAFLHGARLVGLRREEVLAPPELAAAIRRHGLTVHLLTAAWFHRVAAERPDAFAPLSSLIIGGEAGEPRAFAAVLAAGPPRRLIHAYGPTEVTTLTSAETVRAVAPGATILPAGLPLANTRVAVLDSEMRLLPPGVPGELFAGGDGVARGYLGRPDLTAERFVPDPFGPPGERLYATGDLARLLPGGALEILGRRDLQVKIRGFRIELAEIEAALGEHPGVAQVAVIVREEAPGDKRLIGFVVPREPVDPAELRDLLAAKLPAFMVPAAILVRPDLPLTSNGKLDRAALSRLSLETRTGADGEAPRTAAEDLLATLWAGLLGVERPGPHDDFFALGGHSLLGAQLVARVREVFGVELPVRAIFEEPTLGALAAHIEALQRSGAPAAPPIRRRHDEGPPPLTFAQRRFWFLDRLTHGREAYNIPTALRIEGSLDPDALEQAIHEIQRRHEALRTTFAERDGEPVAVVSPEPLGEMVRLDVPPDKMKSWLAAEGALPFDLERGPVLRATLLRLAPEEHVLALTLHHIVADGWSVGVLVREMAELYAAAREGRPARLPELPIQLSDYARWQRESSLNTEVALRRERLDGAPLLLDLPVDHPWPAEPSGRGGLTTFFLPPALSASLYALARRESVTPFMLLLTGFAALLARWCGQDDLLIGAPIAGRDRRETENLVGLLANTLVLRADLRGEPSLREALRRVREMALDTFAHADLPFEKLVEELQPEQSLARPPLVQVTFALQNLPPSTVDLPGLTLETLTTESGAVKVELSLTLVEREEGFAGTLEHAVDLFEARTARRMLAGYETLLAEMAAADPDRPLLDLEILSEP